MLADVLLEIAPRRFTIKLLMSRSAAALPDNADAGTVLEVLQKKGAARRREIADKQKLGKTATRSRIRELGTHGTYRAGRQGPRFPSQDQNAPDLIKSRQADAGGQHTAGSPST